MRIGIDISQLAFKGTGVAKYLQNLVEHLLTQGSGNEYVLFYSSMRRPLPDSSMWKTSNGQVRVIANTIKARKVTISQFLFPPTLLDLLWNKLHVMPIEWLIGPVDVFISSDWTQPPGKAKKATIIYDLIVYTYPEETARAIVSVQKRRLAWVKKEVDRIICISKSSKKDVAEILHIPENKISVVYPGVV